MLEYPIVCCDMLISEYLIDLENIAMDHHFVKYHAFSRYRLHPATIFASYKITKAAMWGYVCSESQFSLHAFSGKKKLQSLVEALYWDLFRACHTGCQHGARYKKLFLDPSLFSLVSHEVITSTWMCSTQVSCRRVRPIRPCLLTLDQLLCGSCQPPVLESPCLQVWVPPLTIPSWSVRRTAHSSFHIGSLYPVQPGRSVSNEERVAIELDSESH